MVSAGFLSPPHFSRSLSSYFTAAINMRGAMRPTTLSHDVAVSSQEANHP